MQITGGLLERGSVVGGYRIDELIGRGGMGVVYRATHVALGRIYALKVLAPELAHDEQFRQRFRREMRIAASLHHPNVVGIHYAGEHEGLLFLVMDFITGTDLHEVMRKADALEPDRACALLEQLASALDAAHRKGLVHRDVKPENVLITVRDGEEHEYLTDFGVAKRFDTVSGVSGLTQKGAVVGTVDYMSPEQISGAHVDARTDIYALGCIFFRMLTGHVPYERENSVATLFAHVHNPPPTLTGPLAEQYPNFGAVIEKAMAKEPEDRYLSAGDFARDAAAALGGMRYTAQPTVVATGEASLLRSGEDAVEHPSPRPEPWEPSWQTTVAGVDPEPAPAASTTTEVPVTEVPTTDVPATDVPATEVPATEVPATDVPATEVPATEVPATRVPARALRGMSAAPPAATASGRGGLGPPRRPLGRYRWPALAVLVCVAAAIAAVIVFSSSSSPTGPLLDRFAATASQVPTNRVTGSGTATVQLRGNVATVMVDTNGLVAAVHLMHIHGGTGNCPPASAAQLYKGHPFISAGVGERFYGGVVASLTQTGDTSPAVHLVNSLYAAVGNIRYSRTFTLGPGVAAEIRQGLAVIIVHGINYDGNTFYDNFLGPGAEAAAPALCGPLVRSQTAATGKHGPPGAIYTASLAVYSGSSSQQSLAPLLLCHIAGVPVTLPPTAADSPVRSGLVGRGSVTGSSRL